MQRLCLCYTPGVLKHGSALCCSICTCERFMIVNMRLQSYGITIEMSKQQKQHKIKICYFHQLLQWECPNVRKRSVKEHLLKKKNIFFQTSNELPLPPRPQPVFFATESNRIAGRRVMLADHDPGAGGSWMGGRGQAWREGQHGGQPILCKPTPICRPALYASSVHHRATSPFQTLPNILFKRRLLTNGVQRIKGWNLCHRDRKMSTNGVWILLELSPF